MDTVEQWIRTLGGVAGLTTLTYIILRMLKSLREPKGREEPGARRMLRAPFLLVASVLFVVGGVALWQPLPIQVTPDLRVLLFSSGTLIFCAGLGLYLWGMRSLGQMFGPSTGFGVRLHAAHRLITTGPYAYVRHPMYLAVVITAQGGLLLYRTWAALLFALIMFGLIFRARREEQVLAQEFGAEWKAYVSQVPAWIPRLRRK